MSETKASLILEKLDALRTELVDQAFAFDGQGNPVAADLAMITSVRLSELCQELTDASRLG